MFDSFVRMTRPEFEEAIRAKARSEFLGGHRCVCRVLGEFLLFVDTRDFALAPHLMMDGFWESWVSLAMIKALKPGATAVDVGANVGYFSLIMARCVGATGSVISCEPNPELADLLGQTLVASGFHQSVLLERRAAYSESGKSMDMFVPTGLPMNGRLVAKEQVGRSGTKISVQTIKLDDILPDRVDFIKIDAEGAEWDIWQGMKRVISNNDPIRIFLEFNPRRAYAYDARKFLDSIEDSGFDLAVVGFEGQRAPVTRQELLDGPETILDLIRPAYIEEKQSADSQCGEMVVEQVTQR